MIFVDTSFWVALRNRRDAHHDVAKELLAKHTSTQLTTTNHVPGETWTYLRRRAGHAPAVEFLDVIEQSPRVRVVPVSEEPSCERWPGSAATTSGEYSFTDATSFATMRTMRISEALAFDGDFSAAGFTELSP